MIPSDEDILCVSPSQSTESPHVANNRNILTSIARQNKRSHDVSEMQTETPGVKDISPSPAVATFPRKKQRTHALSAASANKARLAGEEYVADDVVATSNFRRRVHSLNRSFEESDGEDGMALAIANSLKDSRRLNSADASFETPGASSSQTTVTAPRQYVRSPTQPADKGSGNTHPFLSGGPLKRDGRNRGNGALILYSSYTQHCT